MAIVNGKFERYHRAKLLTKTDFVELECDNCGKVIGVIYDFDMNGNYVLCQECHLLLK